MESEEALLKALAFRKIELKNLYPMLLSRQLSRDPCGNIKAHRPGKLAAPYAFPGGYRPIGGLWQKKVSGQ